MSAIHHNLSRETVANCTQARPFSYASLARETLFFTLCVTVAVAPLLQGLYAARERFIVMALVFVCTVGVLALSGRSRTISVAVLGGASLFVLYVIGLVTPASATGAINGFVVMAASIAMFWAWSSSDLKGQAQLQLGAAIVCSALLVAIWGLLTHIGLLAGDAFVGGRLAVGFGYPNATASWLGLGFVLSIMFPRKTLSWAGAVAFDFSAEKSNATAPAHDNVLRGNIIDNTNPKPSHEAVAFGYPNPTARRPPTNASPASSPIWVSNPQIATSSAEHTMAAPSCN